MAPDPRPSARLAGYFAQTIPGSRWHIIENGTARCDADVRHAEYWPTDQMPRFRVCDDCYSLSGPRCEADDHPMRPGDEYILISEGGSIPDVRICTECLSGLPAEERIRLIDLAEMYEGHRCTLHLEPYGPLPGSMLCTLCRAIFQNFDGILSGPASPAMIARERLALAEMGLGLRDDGEVYILADEPPAPAPRPSVWGDER